MLLGTYSLLFMVTAFVLYRFLSSNRYSSVTSWYTRPLTAHLPFPCFKGQQQKLRGTAKVTVGLQSHIDK